MRDRLELAAAVPRVHSEGCILLGQILEGKIYEYQIMHTLYEMCWDLYEWVVVHDLGMPICKIETLIVLRWAVDGTWKMIDRNCIAIEDTVNWLGLDFEEDFRWKAFLVGLPCELGCSFCERVL